MKMKRLLFTISLATLVSAVQVDAQGRLTRDQILSMSTEELSDLPLDELMQAVETLGVSSVDELFALIMNKNVSSASKKEESSFTSPLASTVITHDELRTYGCTTVEEAMRLIPGMIVQQKANGVYDVHVRGLNNIPDNNMLLYTENNNTLLMVDGRVMHNYGTGTMSMENLPISIEDIERIEVVRGAASAMYGQNAVNGVINIITRKPDQSPTTVSGSFQMGNQSTFVGDIALRKAFSSKVAGGLTFNMQYREKVNDKTRTLSDSQYYLDMEDNYGAEELVSAVDVQEAVAAGKLIPVAGNEELNVDQYNHLRNMSTNLLGAMQLRHYIQQRATELAMGGMDVEQATQQATQEMMQTTKMYSLYKTTPIEYADAYGVFPYPRLSRKNVGINGYLTFTPTPDVRIDFTGGYTQAYVTNTTLVECPYAFNMRVNKQGYVNADAHVKDLHLQVNYAAGPADYSYGRPGLKLSTQNLFGTIEYDINVGDAATWGTLGVRPGLSYQYVYYKDQKPTFDYGPIVSTDQLGLQKNAYGTLDIGEKELSGFLNDDMKLTSVAPALRFDYQKSGFRLILAVRGDKTNVPDKWNTSAQVAASYKINDKNFVRASWGRGFRAASMVGAGAKYLWLREGMGSPNSIRFKVNEDADIMHADNFELGYRLQPTQNLLIDAELFYSKSSDYGAMTAESSEMVFLGAGVEAISGLLERFKERDLNDIISGMDYGMQYAMNNYVQSRTYTKYDNMPFKVHQIGFGVNVDWVISPKLIAKINANIQKTTIDNYYRYEQVQTIAGQISAAAGQMGGSFADGVWAVLGRDCEAPYDRIETTRTREDIMRAMMTPSDAESVRQSGKRFSDAEFAEMRSQWFAGHDDYTSADGTVYKNSLAMYYALRYGVKEHEGPYGVEFTMGDARALPVELEDGHEHKATPSVYGMVGLIAKPVKSLNIAAYGNFIGKRTYQTMYGAAELDPRFTVNLRAGYKPTDSIELFVNGNNLFNSKKQEFVYSDEIGGIYTIGVNFGF